MRRFESIVMSESEPVNHGTLWLRKKMNSLDPKGPMQFEIWYFGDNGWQPLADFDTRYSIDNNFNYTGNDKAVNILETKDIEHGTVNTTLDFFIYDGSRQLANNNNLVNESGLKTQVDNLLNKINQINSTIQSLESRISSLENS